MNCCQENEKKQIDPVCGMKVDQPNPKLVTTYHQNTYYFCAEACLKDFEKNPGRYLDANGCRIVKKKGIWGRYLERLNRATNGKAMTCH